MRSSTCRRLTTIFLFAVTEPLWAGQSVDVSSLIKLAGICKGVCAVPDCGQGELAIAIAQHSEFQVHAFDNDRAGITAGIEVARERGLLGNRIVFESIGDQPLPYASDFVDLVVIERPTSHLRASEIVRVVRPRGCVLIRGQVELVGALGRAGFEVGNEIGEWTVARKPKLANVDDWSHWCHDPSNNPVSNDTVIQAPYLTQWLGVPYYHAMPVQSTAAAGRVFVASGHIAHHDREIPTLNTLVARNGYNGQVLWSRRLPQGYLVHRSAFIATENVFFMVDGSCVRMLNPETGTEIGQFEIPDTPGTIKWMAKAGTVFYLLLGPQEPPAEPMIVGSTGRGWGWNHVDKNYSPEGRHQIRWGFGETLAAYDLTHAKLLWKHQHPRIDSRGMAVFADKLFYYVPAKRLACLDRETGEVVWANEEQDVLSLIEEEAQGLPGTPGFRTTAMLLATPEGLFLQGQKRSNVVGFSIDEGRFLWSKKKFHNNPNMLFAQGKLFISGIQQSGSVQVIDPATGETLEDLNFWKGSCTRLTGSPEALYCRGEGLGRYDFKTKIYSAERTARPGCNDGAIPANGLLYVGPWLCDCNLSMLGQMVLGSADTFHAHDQKLSDENLERSVATQRQDGPSPDAQDWPSYRANNQRTASSAALVPESCGELWRIGPGTKGALQTQPVAAGDFMVTAGDDGIVRCFDTQQQTEKWWFATGGPVLASPTLWDGAVYVGAGDGYAYCLDASSGGLLWRFRVAPIQRRIMVYGRIASNWPVNSGVLIENGVAYAAAGIMFRDGTHVVALDAKSGRLRWHNGVTGKPLNDRYELEAASASGSLALGQGRLWLASGNVVAPVAFDLQTGAATVTPAQRVPEWNAVMAQKPEPAGRDIMVMRDRFIVHGGRLLYSGEGPVVSASQMSFRVVDQQGDLQGPAFTPVRFCATTPAWDDEIFVTPTSRYGDVLAWDSDTVGQRIAGALHTMVSMDQDIPGDTPQKWGQYNLIGRVFATVERQLRSTSQWPAMRDDIYAIAVARNVVIMTGRERNLPSPCFVAAYAKADRKVVWKIDLPAAPRLGGLSVDRHGNVFVTMQDGSIGCVTAVPVRK